MTGKRNPKKKVSYARWEVSYVFPLYVYVKYEPDIMDLAQAKKDAYSALGSEFGEVHVRQLIIKLKGDPVIVSTLPDNAMEVRGAKGWAWIARRSKNPSKGKTALKRTGQALKGFARGALSAGSEILGAGAMALNPQSRGEKARKADERKWRKSINIMRSKGWTLKQIKDRVWLMYGLTLEVIKDDQAIFARMFGVPGFTLDLNEPQRGRKTPNPSKRIKLRNKYIDLVIKGQAKKTPDGWRVGKKTFAQGRGTVNVSSGYYLDRATGLVYAKRARNAAKKKKGRNPDYPYWNVYHIDTKKTPPYDKTFLGSSSFGMDKKEAIEKFRRSHYPGRLRAGTKIIAEKGVISTKNPRRRNAEHKDSDHPIEVTKHWRAGPPGYLTPWQRAHHAGQSQLFETGIKPAKKRNPTRKGMRKRYGSSKRVSKMPGAPYSEKSLRKLSRTLQQAKKRNPSAESIRKKFAGRVTGERDVFVPSSTPKGKLAKLGNLVLIVTEQGTIKPVRGTAVLLADTRGKLHIGTTSKSNLFNGPRQNFGEVKRIEYDSSKPHLGYPSPIIWHHKLGEETGERPTLHADGQGGLVFRGGKYRLTRRGIEN